MEVNPLIAVTLLLIMAYVFLYLPQSQIRQFLVYMILFMIGYALILTVAEMPTFGALEAPAHNFVAVRYLEGTVKETGALNAVTAVITDYRAFDTLGEVTVLFTAVAAALATLKSH